MAAVPQRLHCGQPWRHWCCGASTRAQWWWPGAGPARPRNPGRCSHLLTPAPEAPLRRTLGEQPALAQRRDHLGGVWACGSWCQVSSRQGAKAPAAPASRAQAPPHPGPAWPCERKCVGPGGRPPPGLPPTDSALRSGWSPGGGLQNSPWGRAHSTLSVGAGAVSPLLLAASMAVFRSYIHFSFSSRELWAGAEAQLPGRAHGRGCLSWPLSQGQQVGGHYPLCTQPAPLKLERGAKSPLLR